MQRHKDVLPLKSPKELEKLLGSEQAEKERLELAHSFRYATQGNVPGLRRTVPYENVSYVSFYSSHRKAFVKLHFILSKYGLDYKMFSRYVGSKTRFYTPEPALSASLFKDYATWSERERTYSDIHGFYLDSVSKIASLCAERGIPAKRFLIDTIKGGRLAYEYVSGRMCRFMIAALPGFKDIYCRLDPMNKSELGIIYRAAEELRTMLDEAMIKTEGRYAEPIRDIDEAIKKLKQENQNKNTTKPSNNTGDNKTCAHSALTSQATSVQAPASRT